MAYEPKPGDISVFKNDRKERENQPDYRVTGLDLDGNKIKGALWLKTDRNGNKYMSGKIEADNYQREADHSEGFRSSGQEVVARGGGGGSDSGRRETYDLSDDIPFVRQAFDGEA